MGLRKMKILMAHQKTSQRISPESVLDYAAFSQASRNSTPAEELENFEKFIAAGILIREGYDAYLNPILKTTDDDSTFEADACGVLGNRLLVALCSTGSLNDREWNAVSNVAKSANAQALILSPQEIDRDILEQKAPGAIAKEKVRIEMLGWFEDTLERTLQETLHTIELLVNETRMRMMAPLLRKSTVKKDLRARINPKLVYHNLSALAEAGLVAEPTEGTYELSPLGRTVLPEFIAFLERTRRALDDHRNEEVKSIGRR